MQDELFEQMANISKAHAYDIVSKQRDELVKKNETLKEELRIALFLGRQRLEENEKLSIRVEYLENLIEEYTNKMLTNLNKKP